MLTVQRGQIIASTPEMVDPNFERTVVLMIEHGVAGSLGVILNRPSEVPVRATLPEWADAAAAPAVLFAGGPVDGTSALGLATVVDRELIDEDGFSTIAGELGNIDLARPELQVAVSDVRIFQGYAGWAPGQLDAELAAGGWFVFDAMPRDVLSGTPEGLWAEVFSRQGGTIAMLADYPDDPSLN